MKVALALALAVLAACGGPDVVECDDGRICPRDSVCDDAHGACVQPEQVAACAGADDGDACAFQGNDGRCVDEVCLPQGCGDGFVDPPEECDGTETPTCEELGFTDGSASCTPSCIVDTSGCT